MIAYIGLTGAEANDRNIYSVEVIRSDAREVKNCHHGKEAMCHGYELFSLQGLQQR